MGVVPAQDPGQGKAIMKINELNTHTDKPTKGKEVKPSRGKSTIYNLVLSKEKGWPQDCVGRSDTDEGWMLEECHTYTRNVPHTCNKQGTNKILSHFYQLI
jgi:hypothetical protein